MPLFPLKSVSPEPNESRWPHDLNKANDSFRPNPAAPLRLRGTHQAARHHADRDDRLVRLLLRRLQERTLLLLLDPVQRLTRDRLSFGWHGRSERGHGIPGRWPDAPHRQPADTGWPYEPAARVDRRRCTNRGRRVLSRVHHQHANRSPGTRHRFCLSRRLYAAKTDQPYLYVRRRLPRRNAGGPGLGRHPRTPRTWRPRHVRHRLLLAVPSLLFHRLALSRRLRGR